MDQIDIIHKVYINTLQMLFDRGYEINLEDALINKDNFIKKFGKEKEINVDFDKLELNKSRKKDDDKICIKWFYSASNDKLDTQYATEFFKKLEKEKINRGIIILPNKNVITPVAKKAIQEPPVKDSSKNKIIIDLFYYHELIINITQHHLVPKHTLLSKEQKDELFKKYKLTENQLPRIHVNDPVSKYLGLVKKDVIKIEKQSNFATRYVSYRIII
jgi:DNA-directed RNA polymerase I, II, and III subunit RPABC1